MEPNHLCLLVLHLLLHGEKHLEKLIAVVHMLVFSDLHLKWQNSVEMRILNVRDVDVG